MSPYRHFVACSSLIYGVFNLAFWCLPLLLLALIRLLTGGANRRLDAPMAAIYRAAVRMNDFWFHRVLGYRWHLPRIPLNRDGTYLVIANHQSWADSFLIQSLVSRRGPILKVLVKTELMRFPILGLIFWAYDFPRLKRRAQAIADEPMRRAEDEERIRAACATLRAAPAAMLIYPEGTRFTTAKHAEQPSPFHHLLPPRAGGFATVLDALSGHVDGVLDLSIHYPESTRFWRFLSGSVAEPEMTAVLYPRDVIRDPYVWLRGLWLEKDAWLAERKRRASRL